MSEPDIIEGEVISPPTVTALTHVTQTGGITRPVVSSQDVVAAFREYQEARTALLGEGDYQEFREQGRVSRFVKRSGWRKLAIAYGVTFQIVERVILRDEQGEVYDAEFIVRATAPNGRFADGWGACSGFERCCPPQCRRSHRHCAVPCSPAAHFSKPRHDIPATAECVPLRAQALTRERGWQAGTELLPGEEILAYDPATDTTCWLPLLDSRFYENAATATLRGASFRYTCTWGHTWAIRQQGFRRRHPHVSLLPVERLRKGQQLVLAAPLGDTVAAPISPRDAAVLGWIATEGTVRWGSASNKKNGKDYGPYGPYLRVHIDQSKPDGIASLRALLCGDATEKTSPAGKRTFPTGRTYATLPSVRFFLKAAYANDLFRRAGIRSKADLPTLATRLGYDEALVMLVAMLEGDGSHRGRGWVFGQKTGPVLDTFHILAALTGRALGLPRERIVVEQTVRAGRFAEVDAIRVEPAGGEDVWCPMVRTGAWVMRLDNQVVITGNTRAKNRAAADLFGMGEVSAEEVARGRAHEEEDDSDLPTVEPVAPTVAAEAGALAAHVAAGPDTHTIDTVIGSVRDLYGLMMGASLWPPDAWDKMIAKRGDPRRLGKKDVIVAWAEQAYTFAAKTMKEAEDGRPFEG